MVVNAAGKVSDLLRATAVNHANCDQQSAIGAIGMAAALLSETPAFPLPVVPAAVGGGTPAPAWWLGIRPYVQGDWPGGNVVQLREAATAWVAAAAALSGAAELVSKAAILLAEQQSGDMARVVANCDLVVAAIQSVAKCCGFAATSCTRYAAAIERTRGNIVDAMQPLNRGAVLGGQPLLIPIPGGCGGITTVWGVATLPQLVAAGASISGCIAKCRVSAASDVVVGGPVKKADALVAKLTPLLQAHPMRFGTASAGCDGAGAVARTGRVAGTTEESVAGRLDTYLLNPEHRLGGPKADWFRQALGFTRENMEGLADQIVFDEHAAEMSELTSYGTKYNQWIPINGTNGNIIPTKFTWMRGNDEVVRLITATPTKMSRSPTPFSPSPTSPNPFARSPTNFGGSPPTAVTRPIGGPMFTFTG